MQCVTRARDIGGESTPRREPTNIRSTSKMRDIIEKHSEIMRKATKYVLLKRSNYWTHHHISRRCLSYFGEREFVHTVESGATMSGTEALRPPSGQLMLKQPRNTA